MLRLYIFVLFITFPNLTFSQKIKEIKKKASENKSKKTRNNTNHRSSNNNSSDDLSSFLDGCFGCLNIFGDLFSKPTSPGYVSQREIESQSSYRDYMIDLQSNLASKVRRRERRDSGKGLSLELLLNANIIPNTYSIYKGNIRLGYDIFSTEYRYNTYFEKILDETERFDIQDWQIIQVHPFKRKYLDWYLGAGIIFENLYDNLPHNTFVELTTGLDIFALETDLKISPEFRIARDIETGNNPRIEINGQIQYGVINNRRFKLYLGLDAVYARFYSSIDLWSVGIGTHIIIK